MNGILSAGKFNSFSRFALAFLLETRGSGYLLRKSNFFGAKPLRQDSLLLKRWSPLGEAGKEIFLSEDQVIYEQVRLNGFWAIEEVKFIVENLEDDCVLLDLGANAGLISRQVLFSTTKNVSAVCVEPIPKKKIL